LWNCFLQQGLFIWSRFFGGWLVVGNIIKAIFKTDEAGFFPFAIAMGALAYYCAYVLR